MAQFLGVGNRPIVTLGEILCTAGVISAMLAANVASSGGGGHDRDTARSHTERAVTRSWARSRPGGPGAHG